MDTVELARNDMFEWWFIFSQTGEINDCMAFMESFREYNRLLTEELEVEM